MKKGILAIAFLMCITDGFGQKLPKGSRRTLLTLNLGTMLSDRRVFRLNEDLFYNPNLGEFEQKRAGLHLPLGVGLNYTISKRAVLKGSFEMSQIYSKMGTIYAPVSNYWLVRELHPFLVKDFSFGIQLTNRRLHSRYMNRPKRPDNYYAPVVRNYIEFEYVHSFYQLQTEFIHDNPNIQFSTLTFGMYKNFFFKNANSFMAFAGVRVGIPLYFSENHIDYLPQNTEGTLDKKDTWRELYRYNSFLKSFQLRWGVKYLLPF